MADKQPSHPEDEGLLVRAFEARHPGLALAWRMIRRRPFTGAITAVIFVAASTIVLEGGKAANTLFQRWADVNWYAPFESDVKLKALHQGAQYMEDRMLHVGDPIAADRELKFYAVENGYAPPRELQSLEDIEENDPAVISRDPETIRAGQKFTPVFDARQDLAVADGYAYVYDGQIWGLVPLDDYKAAGLPEKDAAQ